MFFFRLIKYGVLKLEIIDIIIFSILLNLHFDSLLRREIQTLIAILILRKHLLQHIFTKFLEPIFFISGAKINTMVLANLLINNMIFILISCVMIFVGALEINIVCVNLYILNFLIGISSFIKYASIFRLAKHRFTLNIVQQACYYSTFFIFYLLDLEFKILSVLLIYVLIFRITNRTLNYDDLTI